MINQTISDLPVYAGTVPNKETQALDKIQYSKDVFNYLGYLNSGFTVNLNTFTDQLELFRTQANTTQDEINASEAAIASMKSNIDTTKADIDSKKTAIDTKHQEVTSYVIPTNATYNTQTIDDKQNDTEILILTGAI